MSKLCIYKYNTEITETSDESNNEVDEEEKKAQEIKAQDKILENIEKGFTSEKFNTTNIENGKDEIIETNRMTITLTNIDNQKNKNIKNVNTTTINIGVCENLLRKAYNISQDQKIYMKKIDVIQEGMKIPKVEYDLYSKLNGSNLIKLNLSVCQNTKVNISVPIIITESLDKLNTSSGYFNDICYTSTSDNGTDITLKDRKDEFIKGNKAVCQDGCEFSEYDYQNKKAQCSCDVKQSSNSYADMLIDKEKLFKNFVNIKNIANVHLLKCYKSLFSKNGIKRNIGFYTIIVILVFHLVCLFIFYKNETNKIEDKIQDIIFGIKNWQLVNEEKKEKSKTKKLNTITKTKSGKNKRNKKKKVKKEINNENNNCFQSKQILIKDSNSNPPKKIKRKNKKSVNNNIIRMNTANNINNIILERSKNQDQINEKNKIIQKTKEIMAFKEQELNQLKYNLALQYDKRSYCEYYLSLIKTKHNLIFSFYYKNDYNSRIIKKDLFLISFIIHYTVNALFFNDSTMHKIYEDNGKFQFIYQLPQIIYSSIISAFINSLLKILSLSEEGILEFKQNKKTEDLEERKRRLDFRLRIKFILFFIISIDFILMFWYYLSMFCAIYVNTQIHLIKDSLISFGLSLLYPFGIYLLPGFFRSPSLSGKNKENKKNGQKRYLYTSAKLLQFL